VTVKVEVGGRDVTGLVQGRLTVRRGRDSVYTEPSAGYASIDLRSTVSEPFRVGQTVKVFLSDSADQFVQLFGGVLSDVDAQAVRVQGGVLVGYRLTAVGPLARLNRRTVLFGGRPSEDDGDRVLAALLAGLASAWEEQNDSLAWDDAEGTWDTFDGIDTSLVDSGVFTLAALGTADGGYNPLRVAQEAAFSGLGMIYETRTGEVAYADAARRADNADAGYSVVPAGSLSADGVQVTSSLSDITNRVTVEFDGGVVTVTDDDSLVEFGLFQTGFTTQLVNQSNAELWADRYVENHSLPVFRADQFRLTLESVGTALTDSLLVVEPNDAVVFTGLPTALGLGASFEGFVEGVEWSVDPFRTDVGLFVSDAQLSLGSIWWGRVGGTLVWSAVGTATAWQDVERTLV
jgi:hypothetical protein